MTIELKLVSLLRSKYDIVVKPEHLVIEEKILFFGFQKIKLVEAYNERHGKSKVFRDVSLEVLFTAHKVEKESAQEQAKKKGKKISKKQLQAQLENKLKAEAEQTTATSKLLGKQK